MKFYITCPANVATGGPELLHQLCYKLRKKGYQAWMYYIPIGPFLLKDPVPKAYKHYSNPFIMKYQDNSDNILIVPETMEGILKKFPLSKKVFWWLSVDNFYSARRGWEIEWIKKKLRGFGIEIRGDLFLEIKEKLGLFYDIKRTEIIHLVQSHYAEDHCKKIGIQPSKILYLSDYLSNVFFESGKLNNHIKENIILFNPKKGYEFTSLLRRESPFFQWIPLMNLSSKDMIDLMSRAKVYIDFGNHPGKDRIPREAAINGCCIITGKRGSARFQEDVSIPEEFKFNDSCKNIPRILRKIEEIFLDYENVNKKFGSYREKIRMEEKAFEEDLDVVCQYLKCFTKNMQGREVNEVV